MPEASKQLILSRITDDFDPVRDVPLGPWCFGGLENVYPQWQSLPFVDAFENSNEIYQWYVKSGKLSAALAWRLTHALNRRHSTTYSVLFWREILIPFLCLIIQWSLSRYIHIAKFIERHQQDRFDVSLSPPDIDFRVSDISKLSALGKSPEFEHWLSSLIMRELAPADWNFSTASSAAVSKNEQSETYVAGQPSSSLRGLVRRAMGRLSFTDILGVDFAMLPLSLYLNLLPAGPNNTPDHEPQPPDPTNDFPAGYLKIVDTLIEKTMPLPYGDTQTFRRYDDEARAKKYKRGRLLVTSATRYNDANRFTTAHAKESGERVVRSQHGINPGTSRFLIADEYEYDQHAYLSWGWSEHEQYRQNIHPVPSPFLSKIANRHRFSSDDLVMIGTKTWTTYELFRPIPQPAGFIRYREEKISFLQGLDRSVLEYALYRPYLRGQTGLDEVAFLEDVLPDLKILKGDLQAAMMSAKLVIHDHPGSSLLIGMAANVPTVGYWERNSWPLCPQAEPFFQALYDAGILFDNAAAAAVHVNTVWGDVPGWWSSEPVRAAHRVWTRQFARTSSTWWLDWLKILRTL